MAARAQFAHANSTMVWDNHCLIRPNGTGGESMLDQYARWREREGDPISREEYSALRRRVLASALPEDAQGLLDALDRRIEQAQPRSKPPTSPARGAEPDFATLSYMEANDRGVEQLALEDVDGALRYFRRAVEMDPKGPYALANLALSLQRKKEIPEALRTIESAIAASPKSAFVYPLAAQIATAAGNAPRARELLKKGLELEPENTEILSQLGVSLFESKDVKGAIWCFERAVAFEPDRWEYALTLAQILASVPASAVRAQLVLDQALRIHPNQPELLQLRQQLGGR